jgi:hypothetical protein
MLQFFSASTNIVNSKRAITECLENALQGELDLNCDLIIIYSAMGHNFSELISEAHKLSPGARIAGCSCMGIIGKNGSDESLKALNIMVIKGPKNEFALTSRKTSEGIDSRSVATEMAQELNDMNPDIRFVQFIPSFFEWQPYDEAIEGIKSVFGPGIPIFGNVSVDNGKGVNCYHFFDDQVVERGAVMIGYADPTLKFICRVNHGFSVIEGMPFEVTRYEENRIFELNNKPAWPLYTGTLGLPESTYYVDVMVIAGLATELPEKLHEEYGSKYILFMAMKNNGDGSFNIPIKCKPAMKIWLTRRDEKMIFDGVDSMVKKISDTLNGKKPVAVFHSDCGLRGKLSLNRVLKDELVNRIQFPISKGENIPWFGLYSGGEFGMLGGETWFHQMSSSLFVIYR